MKDKAEPVVGIKDKNEQRSVSIERVKINHAIHSSANGIQKLINNAKKDCVDLEITNAVTGTEPSFIMSVPTSNKNLL